MVKMNCRYALRSIQYGMAGYSKTPLIKKLGIKPGYRVCFVDAPETYPNLLGPLPEDVEVLPRQSKDLDFIHLFSQQSEQMEEDLYQLKDQIRKDGMIWISWYKKSARMPTDITEDVIRGAALALGLVDVKVCAVDEQWSGLKLVWRKENR